MGPAPASPRGCGRAGLGDSTGAQQQVSPHEAPTLLYSRRATWHRSRSRPPQRGKGAAVEVKPDPRDIGAVAQAPHDTFRNAPAPRQ